MNLSLKHIVNYGKNKLSKTILEPVDSLVDESITDVVTTIGAFIIKSIKGRFQRSISFNIGINYTDQWMEDALFEIIYLYNDIRKKGDIELTTDKNDKSKISIKFRDGIHNLKYRNYNIILSISSSTSSNIVGNVNKQTSYTIITYDLSPAFVKHFEQDMIYQRNRLLGLRIDSPTINVYQDLHEGDGDTYWEKKDPIYKKRIKDIYLPRETKLLIVNTINNFFASKKYYKDHGITHNLKILLYSPPACGKDSIARMIASEYNRNLYYVNGGKGGKFVPEAIQSNDSDVNYPLFLISDIDKYPFLITDTNVNLDEEDNEDRITNKLLFGKMINALDGILSGEDRIIVMTTNYIEKFSPVFLRSGRINLLLEIGYVTSEVFRKYVYDFYGEILPKNIKLNNDKLTIAELQFDAVFLKLSFDEFVKKYIE